MAQDPTAASVGGKDKMVKDGWDASVSWTERQIAITQALANFPMDSATAARLTAELAVLNQGEAIVWPKGRPKKTPNT
jgi:hypothetical protein